MEPAESSGASTLLREAGGLLLGANCPFSGATTNVSLGLSCSQTHGVQCFISQHRLRQECHANAMSALSQVYIGPEHF